MSAAVVARGDTAASGSENGFSRPGICQCHVLKRADEPRIVVPGEHGKDQRIDLMRAGRVSRTDCKTTPEVYNRRPITDRDHIDQIIFEIRITIDRLVDGNVKVDDFLDAAHIVPEPIHECRVAMEQGSESLHVVSVPGGLECVGDILRSFHLSHVDSRIGNQVEATKNSSATDRTRPSYPTSATATKSPRLVEYEAIAVRNGVVVLSWQERIGSTIVHVLDLLVNQAHTFVTPAKCGFMRVNGPIERKEHHRECK